MPVSQVNRIIPIVAVIIGILVAGVVAVGVVSYQSSSQESSDDQSTTSATRDGSQSSTDFSELSHTDVCRPVTAKAKEFGTTDSIEMGAVAEEFKGCEFKSALKSEQYLFRIAATTSMDPVCEAGSKENDEITILDVDVCLNHDETGEFNVDGEKWEGDTMKSDFAVNGITVEVVSQTDKPYTFVNWPWKDFHHAIVKSAITAIKNAK